METKLHSVLESLGCLGTRAGPLLSLIGLLLLGLPRPLHSDLSADSPCLGGLQCGPWILEQTTCGLARRLIAIASFLCRVNLMSAVVDVERMWRLLCGCIPRAVNASSGTWAGAMRRWSLLPLLHVGWQVADDGICRASGHAALAVMTQEADGTAPAVWRLLVDYKGEI